MKDKIIEILKEKTYCINHDLIADEILALPLYEKEFLEWLIFECDILKETSRSYEPQEEMIERLYNYYQQNIKGK